MSSALMALYMIFTFASTLQAAGLGVSLYEAIRVETTLVKPEITDVASVAVVSDAVSVAAVSDTMLQGELPRTEASYGSAPELLFDLFMSLHVQGRGRTKKTI